MKAREGLSQNSQNDPKDTVYHTRNFCIEEGLDGEELVDHEGI